MTSTVAPVGTTRLGRSEEGIYDLAGNVWEWTTTTEETAPGEINRQILRGGSAWDGASTLENTIAMYARRQPGYSDSTAGFRCAADA
jgi:formylglycine-generating enzyme required for sulfatase activity